MKLKKLRFFANRDRVTRTRIVYVALTAGTVLIAFLLVLLNRGIFRLSEASLYDDPKYEAVSIISANSIGAPLSLKTRVAMFLGCERQGDERAVMPDELDAAPIREKLRDLWEDTLRFHAPNGKLVTGESVSAVLKKSRYTVTLRDFYNDETGAKLALWCGQAYYEAEGGRVYCLSAQFDSRMGDVYSMSCALYGNVLETLGTSAFEPFLTVNGYMESLADRAALTQTQKGFSGTLTLPDGLKLSLTFDVNEQYTITFAR